MLMESLGASNVFEESVSMFCFVLHILINVTLIQMSLSLWFSPSEVRSLWTQLRKDEPHLLSNFEEFLARVTYQIKDAQQERKEMESVLKRLHVDFFFT